MVFDSGIGGTTVLEHIKHSIPNAQYSYFMDNALLPYGAQSQQTIINRLCSLIHFIKANTLSVDLIVIACNTASTSALSAVRQITDIPIVGVVPAIKPAAELTRSNHIGLLATPATVASSYTTESLDTNKLHQVLDDLHIDKTIDVLVLGCTHFPILAEPISQYFEGKVKLLDSGVAIANRVDYLLKQLNLGMNKLTDIKKPLQYYATADVFSNKLAVKLVTLTDPSQYAEH